LIHQLIFATPRPGMTPENFQDYWINVHARNFASKIPQIKKYKVSRILTGDETPIFHGMAEIWLENETEQLASLQSDEFIKGARADEPKWAAFWASLCLDTTTVPIVQADGDYKHKLVYLIKRKGGIPLQVFRRYAQDTVGASVRNINGLKAACLCVANDGLYAVGESRFDAAYQLWFANPDEASKAKSSNGFAKFVSEINDASDSVLEFMCEENTII